MNKNKKTILINILLISIVIFVFAYSIFPLKQKNVYEVLRKMGKDKSVIETIIDKAKEKQTQNINLHPLNAIDETIKELELNLAEYVNVKSKTASNQDIIKIIKNKSASPIKLGLDLNGGTEFSLRLDIKQNEHMDDNINSIRNKVIDILRNRIDKSGLMEPEIVAEGSDRISVKIPINDEKQKNEYKKLLEMSAKLEFRLVHENNYQLVQEYLKDPNNFIPPIGYEMLHLSKNMSGAKTDNGSNIIFLVKIIPEMSGANIANAQLMIDQYGRQQISLKFNNKGSKIFGEITSNNIGRQLSIILDGILYTAPVIQNAIVDGNASITGEFTNEEAQNIATALSCGNLPVNIKIDSVFDIAPTLGNETIKNGLLAGIISLMLVALIMILYYLKAGIIANIALIVNIILIMGMMSFLNATLTLAGIAGIILTIGMAVDSNVLIYERIREELESNNINTAIKLGYKGAFSTIFDSNMTTLLVGLILCWIGIGTVRGFGIILSIGIASSMFTAIFVTRLIFKVYEEFFNLKKLPMFQLLTKTKIQFTKHWKIFLSVSLVMILISFATIIIKNNKLLGTEFTGGAQIVLKYDNYVEQDKIKQFLDTQGYNCNHATYKFSPTEGSRLEILLSDNKTTNKILTNDTISDAVNSIIEKYPEANFQNISKTLIGSSVGKQFTKSAILAIIAAILGIIAYLSIRFEFKYSIAAISALLHDIIICVGFLVLCNKQITLTVIAALLTVIGYSVNDTIIIFDRIRENLKLRTNKSYKSIVDLSINQTLSRTIITSFLTLLVVVALFIFGGTTINSFALTMIVGIVVGTYSSICTAAPIVAVWHKKAINIKD